MQETTNLRVSDRYAYYLPVLGEHDEFLFNNNRCYVTLSDVQRKMNSTMLRYKENIMR